ncbi:MAG: energy-coupling factor transporter ATP-binding protein EcfA2, partial [Sulfurimonas sp.]
MIKKIILINSANFNFLEVDLQKDLFFLGDNGSGKTTAIRAIHYLYSGDVRNLGIPTDKDGFKEYYFKFSNSYMIYVFEDFFIFMYKAGGEIVKLFSKQKFEISRVIDESSNLYELDVIRRYTREANLKKTVKSLSEYRDIIYGNNKQLLDFKFTSIRNSDTFLGLFNEIFNIDKSIIDSKSIKQAIQTTLDYEKKVIDFNHEEYLQKIYEFQSEYKFFKEFEKQKDNIDGAYELKETLLAYEEDINELKEKILYREKKESYELSQSETKHKAIEIRLSKVKEILKIKVNTKAKCEEKFRILSNTLELDIQRISALKEKYSQENILLYRDRADKYEEILNNQSELNQSYIKLKSGFENELDNINKEIKTLEYKRD